MDMSSQEIVDNADWCNGSTADSDSVSRGSSPLSVAERDNRGLSLFCLIGDVVKLNFTTSPIKLPVMQNYCQVVQKSP